MFKVHFTGYKEGIKKVSLSRLLKNVAGMGLADSKFAIDQLLCGQDFYIQVGNSVLAQELLTKAQTLGAICNVEGRSVKSVQITLRKKVVNTLILHPQKASHSTHRVR